MPDIVWVSGPIRFHLGEEVGLEDALRLADRGFDGVSFLRVQLTFQTCLLCRPLISAGTNSQRLLDQPCSSDRFDTCSDRRRLSAHDSQTRVDLRTQVHACERFPTRLNARSQIRRRFVNSSTSNVGVEVDASCLPTGSVTVNSEPFPQPAEVTETVDLRRRDRRWKSIARRSRPAARANVLQLRERIHRTGRVRRRTS